jgi:hypothetical protein
MIAVIERMFKVADRALSEVSDTLAPSGVASVENVPAASSVLEVYAAAFKAPKKELDRLVDALSETRAALT